MNKNNKSTKCPTCGSTCRIGGDDKEGTHYYVPEEDDLRAKIQDLEKECQKYRQELETFAECLFLSSKTANEPTANSYRDWIHHIKIVLAGESEWKKFKCHDKSLQLVNLIPEMIESLKSHCKYCPDCDFMSEDGEDHLPNDECELGELLKKLHKINAL